MSNESKQGNKSNDSYIWLRVRLTERMHRRLKVMAAERGDTLQGLVVQVLGQAEGKPVKVGGEVVRAGAVVVQVDPKPASAVSKHLSAYTAG